MSITRMRRKMGAGMKIILGVVMVIFIVSIPIVFGTRQRGPLGRDQEMGITKVVAVVNGEEISRRDFLTALARIRDFYSRQGGVGIESLEHVRASTLNSLIEREVEIQTAKARGIRVSRGDVKRETKKRVDEETAAYRERYGERANVREFAARLRNLYGQRGDEIRQELIIERLRKAIESQVKVTDQDLLESYGEVEARHILVGTRERPGAKKVSDAEARKKAENLLKQIKAGADFAELAERESDDPGSAPQGGSLGWVKRGQMVPEFEKAAFALKKGETSGVVKSPFGYHIVRVTDRRRSLPEDFKKNKKELREELLRKRQMEAWVEFTEQQREKAKVTVPDPELRGARAYLEGDHEQALKDFQKALEYAERLGEDVLGAVHFSIGQIHLRRKEWRKAAQALEESVDIATLELLPIYLALGQAYLEMGNKEKAREWYQSAADEYPDDTASLWQLKQAFEKLGDQERAAEMDGLLQEEWKRQMEEAAERRELEVPPSRQPP